MRRYCTGTSVAWVARLAWACSRKRAGSNRRMITVVPHDPRVMIRLTDPPVEYSGVETIMVEGPPRIWPSRTCVQRMAWDWTTPLGDPVVPEE